MFLSILCAGLSAQGELKPYGFKMSVLPIWCSLFGVKHWRSLLNHVWYLGEIMHQICGSYPFPSSFSSSGTLENRIKVDLVLHTLTHILPAIRAVLWSFKSQLWINSKLQIPARLSLPTDTLAHVGLFDLLAERPKGTGPVLSNVMGKVREAMFQWPAFTPRCKEGSENHLLAKQAVCRPNKQGNLHTSTCNSFSNVCKYCGDVNTVDSIKNVDMECWPNQ